MDTRMINQPSKNVAIGALHRFAAPVLTICWLVYPYTAGAQETLVNGANHSGNIAFAGQLHEWTFTATQGDFVAVSSGTVETFAGSFAPWIRLISPTGQVLGNQQGTVAQINLTIPVTGTYTVIVGSRSGTVTTGTGSYLLTLARAPGAFVVPEGDHGGPLTNGANHPGSIHLGDLDLWTFAATQGDFVALSSGTVEVFAGSFAPWIRLISPTGQVLGNQQGTVAQINLTIPVTGTYTAIVGSRSGTVITGTGSYLLTLARAPGAFVVPEGDHGGPLTNGVNHPGSIHLGDLDMWTFTATQGDFVALSSSRVETFAGSFAPWIRLISPTGQVLGNQQGTVAQINLTIPVTGTYTVIVGSRSGTVITGTGSYLLTALGASGGCHYTVGPASTSAPAAGGQGTITVTAGTGCAWTAQSNAAWITITAGASGSGNGTVTFSAAANQTGASRTGTLTVAGHTVTVTQASVGVTFTVTPTAGPNGTISPSTPQVVAADATVSFTLTPAQGFIIGSVGGTCGGSVSGSTFTTLPVNQNCTVQASFVPQPEELEPDPEPEGPPTRYLAEGATGDFWHMRMALANPTPADALALLRFLRASGPPIEVPLEMPAMSRRTVDPAVDAGLMNEAFSTVIESDVPLIVDRTMWWDARRYGSHAGTAIATPSPIWYLAEGHTQPFDLFYLIQNPNPSAVTVEVTYLRPAPTPPLVRTYLVAAQSRFNIYVNWIPELEATAVSAVLRTLDEAGIIVERAMYLGEGARAGHASAGVTAPATQWFLAEGATGFFFDFFILLANPTDTDTVVDARFLREDGVVVETEHLLPAQSRANIYVNTLHPLLEDAAMSTVLTSRHDVPIIVERAMYWDRRGVPYEAHNSPGATETGTRWGLADGEAGLGTDTYVLVANTSAFAGRIRMTLLFEDGPPAAREFDLLPNSRLTLFPPQHFPEANGRRFGTVIESLGDQPAQIVVERAMYTSSGGVFWEAGSNILGTRLR
jgi:hypothetical protein